MTPHSDHFLSGRGLAPVAVLLLGAIAACSPGGTDETARTRGDLAFARDSLELALAEYRLAVNQGSDDAWSLARVAHTYTLLGRVEEARDFYGRAVGRDSALADQAAADLLHLAKDAAARRDRFLMASAVDAALFFRPGMGLQTMALPLARHHFENGQYGRALPYYQKAMATAGDSIPELIFEIGQAYEEIGDCDRALVSFERYRELTTRANRTQVDWFIGTCSLRLASELRAAELGRAADSAAVEPDSLEKALTLVDRAIEVGEPRNLMGQAWLEKGEILSHLGRCDAALEAFETVRRVEPSDNTSTARRAQQRFDQVKFGRGLERLVPGRGCG